MSCQSASSQMSPARVEEPFTMTSGTRKRPSTSEGDQSCTKRQRISSFSSHTALPPPLDKPAPLEHESQIVTAHALARNGLRRGIALVLDQLGFDAANSDAMESFVAHAEIYLNSLAEDIKAFTNAARRIYPIPTDFENTLKRFNLTIPAVKPHLKPPIPRLKRDPSWAPLVLEEDEAINLPILGDELDGASDKSAKTFIPASFPAFPSIHTYKYTPEDAELVTHSEDWGALNPDASSQTMAGETLASHQQKQPQLTRPLAPHEIPRGDPKKIREAAVKEAKAGEEALRRLMRASKIAKQKEVWATAQREPARKERYGMWEEAMRELIEDSARAEARRRRGGKPPSTVAGQAPGGGGSAWDMENDGRFEIADHSMMVNSESRYARKEVPRPGTRKSAGEGILGKG